MKDIASYFVDPSQSSIQSQQNQIDPNNGSNSKRNRVRIKISRKSAEGNVCNILDSSSEMIEKTPSPNRKAKTSTEVHDFVDLCSNDQDIKQGSNAFHILMSHNKLVSPVTPASQIEESNKESEEYKQKLKQTNEKLIMLANKKGYSKRKLEELQESEKIEKIIQTRINALRGDVRKDNTTILSPKEPSGSLLNYFSKTTTDLTCNTNLSTIVVKADVHVAEKSSCCLFKSNTSNLIPLKTKSRNDSAEFDSIDEIKILDTENVQVNGEKKQDSKRRWSLRIKMHTYEDENSLPDDSSDEEIFSAKNRNKKTVENSKKEKTILLEKSSVTTEIKMKPSKENNKQNRKLKKTEKLENNVQKVSSDKISSINNLDHIEEAKLYQGDCLIVRENNSKRKTTDKLAPLFTKRRKPDAETLAARRLFLQSDLKDNKKSVDKRLSTSNVLYFPLISHITQLNDVSFQKSEEFNIRLKMKNTCVLFPVENNYKLITDISEATAKSVKTMYKVKIEDALTEIEKKCTDARKMWESISTIVKNHSCKTSSANSKNKKRGKQLDKKELVQSPVNLEHSLWTLKYKPNSSQQVVGNEEAASKLREWLSGWKVKLISDNDNSGDEFYSSDSNCSRSTEHNPVAILVGPHGCGKTASVYAVAEELGYTVLEVNASSRRNGKKMLKELEEATKSHRIKKEKNPSAFHSKEKILSEKIPLNSLIFIEDVDLVFEEDEGFVSATYQLVSNTKRPIAMTCRDVCPNLSKMAPQQNKIFFQSVFGNRAHALLELISLAETGRKLPDAYVPELLQDGDLRKAILQLQYVLFSGPQHVPEIPVDITRFLWQSTKYSIYKPAIKGFKKRKTTKTTKNETISNNNNIFHQIVRKLDSIILLSNLANIDDPAIRLNNLKSRPSLSLTENTTPYSSSNIVSLEIAEWMGQKLLLKEDCNASQQQTMVLKNQLNSGINTALSQITSFTLDQKILATDYLPSIRTICRAEESRATANNKRGKRFFHYLHSLKISHSLLKPNILSTACKIMQNIDDLT